MWGLPVKDLQTREDTIYRLLIGLAALAFLGVVVCWGCCRGGDGGKLFDL